MTNQGKVVIAVCTIVGGVLIGAVIAGRINSAKAPRIVAPPVDAAIQPDAASIADDWAIARPTSKTTEDVVDPFYAPPTSDSGRMRDKFADQIGRMFVEHGAAVAVIAGGSDHTVLEFSVFGGGCTVDMLRPASTGDVGKHLRAVGFKILQCGTEKHDGLSLPLIDDATRIAQQNAADARAREALFEEAQGSMGLTGTPGNIEHRGMEIVLTLSNGMECNASILAGLRDALGVMHIFLGKRFSTLRCSSGGGVIRL